MDESTVRRAARVLVFDSGRVLLFRYLSSQRPGEFSWLTPGGGLEGDEDAKAGAARELAEETGLLVGPADFAGPVYTEEVEYPTADGGWQRQRQEYFVLHRAAFEIDRSAQTEWEREFVGEARWWNSTELRATGERVYPPNLADLVDQCAAVPDSAAPATFPKEV